MLFITDQKGLCLSLSNLHNLPAILSFILYYKTLTVLTYYDMQRTLTDQTDNVNQLHCEQVLRGRVTGM